MWTSLIPLPARWLILLALLGSFGGFCWVKGASHEQDKQAVIDAQRVKQDAAHYAADSTKAQSNTAKLRALFDAAANLRYKENAAHESDLENVRARAAAGTERLHCPGTTLPADPARNDSRPAAGPGAEGGSGEIVPQTAADLFGIGASIARLVRERNALIDSYNAAQATCNAP